MLALKGKLIFSAVLSLTRGWYVLRSGVQNEISHLLQFTSTVQFVISLPGETHSLLNKALRHQTSVLLAVINKALSFRTTI